MAGPAVDHRALGAAVEVEIDLREQVVVDGADHLEHVARDLEVLLGVLGEVVPLVAEVAADTETAAEPHVHHARHAPGRETLQHLDVLNTLSAGAFSRPAIFFSTSFIRLSRIAALESGAIMPKPPPGG